MRGAKLCKFVVFLHMSFHACDTLRKYRQFNSNMKIFRMTRYLSAVHTYFKQDGSRIMHQGVQQDPVLAIRIFLFYVNKLPSSGARNGN